MNLDTLAVSLIVVLMTGLMALVGWLGKRFVTQLDRLSESVTKLAVSVSSIQTNQDALEQRIKSVEERN